MPNTTEIQSILKSSAKKQDYKGKKHRFVPYRAELDVGDTQQRAARCLGRGVRGGDTRKEEAEAMRLDFSKVYGDSL